MGQVVERRSVSGPGGGEKHGGEKHARLVYCMDVSVEAVHPRSQSCTLAHRQIKMAFSLFCL